MRTPALSARAFGILLGAAVLVTSAANAASSVAGQPEGGGIQILNGDTSTGSFIGWGLRQFDAAGLPRPRVSSVTFLSDPSRCAGYIGWVQSGRDGPEIVLCFTPGEACADPACRTWRIPHELARLHEMSHAWLSQNISPEEEAEFVAFAGLQGWQDFDDDWFGRGIEQAAITLASALSGENLPLTPEECRTRAGRFGILTGARPLASRCD